MNIELTHIFYLLLVFVIAHFWWKTMQAREYAEKLARLACQRENVQLLDVTVALKKIAVKKKSRFEYYLLRYFGFEFSSQGDERRSGVIALHGLRQEYIYMDLPEEPTITVETDTSNN